MHTDKNLLWDVGLILCCLAGIILVPSIIEGQTYEVNPYITVPEYKSDAARAIDAYERTMNRYMDVLDNSLQYANKDVKDIAETLKSIDKKLSRLSKRIAKIEEALGISEAEAKIDIKQEKTISAEKKIVD